MFPYSFMVIYALYVRLKTKKNIYISVNNDWICLFTSVHMDLKALPWVTPKLTMFGVQYYHTAYFAVYSILCDTVCSSMINSVMIHIKNCLVHEVQYMRASYFKKWSVIWTSVVVNSCLMLEIRLVTPIKLK